MRRTILFVPLLAAVTLISGCGGGPTSSSVVPWEDYAPTLKSDLDQLATDINCAELQSQFDVADLNNQATMDRTGHNNADLMGYIDSLMQNAGCY